MPQCDYDGWLQSGADDRYIDTISKSDYDLLCDAVHSVIAQLYSPDALDTAQLDNDVMFIANELSLWSSPAQIPVGLPTVSRTQRRSAIMQFAVDMARDAANQVAI